MELVSLLHWSLLAVALLCGGIAEFVKRVFLIKDKTTKLSGWHDLAQRVIPVVLGLAVGLIPGIPLPDKIHDAPSISSVLYFGTAGIFSTYFYSLTTKTFKLIVEKLPGEILSYIKKKLGMPVVEEPKDE